MTIKDLPLQTKEEIFSRFFGELSVQKTVNAIKQAVLAGRAGCIALIFFAVPFATFANGGRSAILQATLPNTAKALVVAVTDAGLVTTVARFSATACRFAVAVTRPYEFLAGVKGQTAEKSQAKNIFKGEFTAAETGNGKHRKEYDGYALF